MKQVDLNQWLNTELMGYDVIREWYESFLMDRKIQNMSPGTIHFYKSKLKLFHEYCDAIVIDHISQITANIIRGYLIYLGEKGNNPGGLHACYRVLKTFLLWWEREVEPEGWKNPILNVKAPKLSVKPLEPVSIPQVDKLLSTCISKSFYDLRDKALFLFLLDTGARASETCSINLEDVDLRSGSVFIKSSKGRKPRTVFIGKKSRRAIRAYLKSRAKQNAEDRCPALWVTKNPNRLTYWGLNQILRRRTKKANIETPSLHDFRRAFALNYLKNGGDIYSLQRLMGHADLQVLRWYLAQTTEDLQIAHRNFNPVDNSYL